MATGISKTKWNGTRGAQPKPKSLTPTASLDVSLSYEGKQPERAILETPPSQFVAFWQNISARNRLYYGENLRTLAALTRDETICGRVRLIYIDPPFATQSVFQSRAQTDAYSDLLAGAHYIEFMRERLILLRELLAEDGSIYVHLDENMAFHVKVIMDEVFGRRNFRNWITRKKCNPKNYTRKAYGNVSDFILFYTKSDTYVWNRPIESWTPERSSKEYQYIEEGTRRRYKKVPVHAPGVRGGETGKPWRGMEPPPGKHWQFTPATLDAMDARGEIYWSPTGNPRRKIYLDESDGVPIQDIWLDYRDAHNQNIHITGYPTEKNPDLLARIIAASSNPGDLVLDCFSGSGTALAGASQLGREWIGIDNSAEAIATTLGRFSNGTKPMGDFVSARKSAAATQHGMRTPSLFDGLEQTSQQSIKTAAHPIHDFSLLAEEPYHGELDAAIAEWAGGRKSARRGHKAAMDG